MRTPPDHLHRWGTLSSASRLESHVARFVRVHAKFLWKTAGLGSVQVTVQSIEKVTNTMVHTFPSRKTVALVAHDNKKNDLIEWAEFNRGTLASHELCATGTTGKILSQRLDLEVTKLQSGPLGGDQQIGAMISQGDIDVLIFFWDPLEPQPHDPDVKALLRMAVVWNIPIACNRSTADFMIASPLMGGTYRPQVPDYGSYATRLVDST